MTKPDARLAADLAEIRATLSRIEARLGAALPQLPPDAAAAVQARAEAKARGFHTVKTFAAVVGRRPEWVSARVMIGTVKRLPGGKPYRIPLGEETRFTAI